MGKKKANNIVINDEELMPTTIGTYSNKAKSPLVVFALIIIFALIAFYLPDIQKQVDKFLGKETSSNINNNGGGTNKPDNPDKPDKPDTPDDTNKKYSLLETSEIDMGTFKISDINYSGNILTTTISSSSSVDLKNYYFEVFDSENMLLGRIKLSDDVVSESNTLYKTYELYTNASQVSVVKKTQADYPEVIINYDANNEGNLVCKNTNNEEYIYTFVSNQLTKIVYSYKVSSTVENYNEIYAKYLNLDTEYKTFENVTSTLSGSENGFDFTLSLNLNNMSSDVLNKINLSALYKVKTTPSEVKFVSEAKGFTCTT